MHLSSLYIATRTELAQGGVLCSACTQVTISLLRAATEEVRHGDVTAGVKRAWNVITADKYSFFILRGILLPVFFNVCTSAGLVDALKVQSSNSNTKVSRIQVHSLSEGPTRGLGVRLTCRSMRFRSSEYQSNSPL